MDHWRHLLHCRYIRRGQHHVCTVKERTAQIGLKKAIGAKKSVILTEFLLESAFLCIIGGVIGLILVFALTKIASAALHFPFFLAPGIIILAVLICIIAGILA